MQGEARTAQSSSQSSASVCVWYRNSSAWLVLRPGFSWWRLDSCLAGVSLSREGFWAGPGPLLPGSITPGVPCSGHNAAFQPRLQNRLCVSFCEPSFKREKLPQRLQALLHDVNWFSPVAVISLWLLPELCCLVVPGASPSPCWQLQNTIRGRSCTGIAWGLGRRVSHHGSSIQ